MAEGNGNSFQPWPLDLKILEILPEEGLIGGVHPRGRRVKDVREEILDEMPEEDRKELEALGQDPISTGTLQSRCSELRKYGFVVYSQGGNTGKIWAKTSKGVQFLAREKRTSRTTVTPVAEKEETHGA
jgi:DNA-binding PadR family transcriptional regulator